ncbi:predicted protein [Nematostella vectensis]|uniref:EGF-like domain-containing protein n=1 Tax=Nematostella vectensis TaxID=45351 RepID=A7SZH1_NEMVE|nr:uncharacterized protein LOC5501721 [Nematostella vectensis]EDO30891.1 predicted protein [Nematostella vectensis]|eukprot:XP_001622991.1 predicted protein [Nematostella vectensis]
MYMEYTNSMILQYPLIFSLVATLAKAHGGSYFKPYSGKVLVSVSMVKSQRLPRPLDCAFACVKESHCASFNMAKSPVKGRYLCQLLSENMTTAVVKDSTVFDHYHRITPGPCQGLNPCHNNGHCEETDDGNDFRCTCSLGLTGKRCESLPWIQFTSSPVCFGSRDSRFARFRVPTTGFLSSIKLSRVSGYISCDLNNPKGANFWGCLDYEGKPMYLNTIITDAVDRIRMPETKHFTSMREKAYNIPGISPLSQDLLFPMMDTPLNVYAGQYLRAWFGLDFEDIELFNEGEVCVLVYGLYA